MSRRNQDELISWTVAALDASPGPFPLDLDQLRVAGLATGLTALAASLVERHQLHVPDDVAVFLDEQRGEVARRQERFAAAIPHLLSICADAQIAVIPVKGAVVAWSHWPDPAARPMADVDLIVHPADMSRTRSVLTGRGYAMIDSTPWEETFLLWGSGAVGRTDGESAAHNGKAEVHPGSVERLHNYLVPGDELIRSAAPGRLFGEPCRLLTPAAFAAHVLGHFSACVIRAEARAVNLIDSLLVLRGLAPQDHAELAHHVDRLDPRSSAPGLWVVARYAPGVADSLAASAMARLRSPARRALEGTDRSAIWRSLGTRTTARWRLAFAATTTERRAVLHQLAWPENRTVRQRVERLVGR